MTRFIISLIILASIVIEGSVVFANPNSKEETPTFPPPGYKGIHQLETEQHAGYVKPLSEQSPAGLKPIPLNPQVVPGVNRIVFGYMPYWEDTNTKVDWLRYNLITHIAWHAASIDYSTGVITNNGWPNTYLINKAHTYGTKVLLSATLFSNGATFLGNASARYTTCTALLGMVSSAGADGITIDVEGVSYSATNQTNMSSFMNQISTTFHNANSSYHVSMAVEPLNTGASGLFDLNALSNYCDSIFIMWYNFYYSGSGTTGPQAPLSRGGYYSSSFSQLSRINSYLSNNNFRPSKIVMGYPLYGEQWNTPSASAHTTGTGFTNVVSGLLTGAASATNAWDTASQTSWYFTGGGSSYVQTWYDSPESMGYKYDLINNLGLGGVGYWAFAYDYSSTQYWDAISTHFFGVSTAAQGIKNANFNNTRSNSVNWEYSNANMTVSLGTASYAGGSAAVITQTSGSGAAFYQSDGRVQGNGDTWTISAWLYQNGFSTGSCNWGWAGSYSPFTKSPNNAVIPAGGGWTHYNVTQTFNDRTTGWRDVQATLTGAGTVYIDEISVYAGTPVTDWLFYGSPEAIKD